MPGASTLEPNEQQLLERARAGDLDAIADLITRYQPDLKRFAQGVCQTSEDAEDAVQHALVVLSTKVGSFRRASKFTTWLFTIVKYECYRLYRILRGRTELSETMADPSPLADELFERSDLLEKVRQAVANLEPDYRDVFLMRDVEQQSTAYVASQLRLSEAAVKSRLHRAREMVRTELLGPRTR